MRERNIVQVIDRIVDVTPTTETRFLARLHRVRVDAECTVPERMRIRWEQLSRVLNEELIEPDSRWKQRISEIIEGRDIE